MEKIKVWAYGKQEVLTLELTHLLYPLSYPSVKNLFHIFIILEWKPKNECSILKIE